MSDKFTKQGVRDLDALLGKRMSQGKKLAEQPEDVVICRHPKDMVKRVRGGGTTCDLCGVEFDKHGVDVHAK